MFTGRWLLAAEGAVWVIFDVLSRVGARAANSHTGAQADAVPVTDRASVPATSTPLPITAIPLAPIIGHHYFQPGDTIFRIARADGVLPAPIVQANNLP